MNNNTPDPVALARSVTDLTAKLNAVRFAHLNAAVKVKRVEELADRLDNEVSRYHEAGLYASMIRKALNGETR